MGLGIVTPRTATRLFRSTPRWSPDEVASRGRRILLRALPVLAVREHHPAPVGWPPGAEEFALLAVTARTNGISPERLYDRARMPAWVGDTWLVPLVQARLLTGGQRAWPFGRWPVTITATGRARLLELRAELEHRAAG